MVDRAGQLIGNYRLERHIASGGMADIYLARHTYLQRQVAVKILHSGMQEREQKAFVLEARLIATLEHPHIVPIYDFGIDDSNPPPFAYLIMEFATGSLGDRYSPGTHVPFATIRSHVSDVASALYYAHERHIIHRDVKPQNILVSGSGTILLSDFGIATLRDTHDEHTIAGTPTFMAPEQIAGRISPAIDQYALGIVVYQWLCGYPPFVDNNLTQLLMKQLNDQPPSLLARVPLLPAEVERVVFKALAKKPEDRFPNVIEFSKALDAAFESAFKQSHIPQSSAQADSSHIPTAPLSASPTPTRSEQNISTPYTSAPVPAIPTTEPAANVLPYPTWNQTPVWGTSPWGSSQQYVLSPSMAFPTPLGTNPWGHIEQSSDSGYPGQGPPTITGYAPPARSANPYAPLQQSASFTDAMTTPKNPFLHFLALLVMPFVFLGRAIMHRGQPSSGLRGQSITSITSFNTITGYGVGGEQATMRRVSIATTRKDFFIAYNRQDEQDRQWADWIAWHLEASGFTVIHPDWDFQAGTNFDMEITKASISAERVIIILSPAYFNTHDSLRKLKRDLSGKQDTVLPVVVHPLSDSFNHPLKGLVAINLAGLDDQTAQERLLSIVRKERQKPKSPPVLPSAFPLQSAWGQPSWGQTLPPQSAWGQPSWEQTLPPQSAWGQPTQINMPTNSWLPPTTTQPVVGTDASTKIMPAASLIPQINDRRNQSADDSGVTVILPASVFASLLASRDANSPTSNQDNTIISVPPISGGKQMSIEQDALKVADFLNALQDMVITDPEFGKFYTDAGRMDNQITMLSTALKTNLQLLQEARTNVMFNPGIHQYQDAVINHLQGLTAATMNIERLWKTFRHDTLKQIHDVTLKVEQESKQLEEGQAQAIVMQARSADGSGADSSTGSSGSQEKAQRTSWIKKASDGLSQFTSFLTLATDIDKAVTQWSPVLFESFKHSLDLLSQLHIF